jgi:rod shape-determining protein MreD
MSMARTILWATIIAALAALLQSTLLARLAILHTVPDLALGVLVYTAYVNGTMTGQVTGFTSGLTLDFLSASPLGFNALVRTIVGALTGMLKGTFFLDVAILPMVLCAAATIVKALVAALANFLFAGAIPAYDLGTPTLWIELAYNTLTAPALFAFLNLFKAVLKPRQVG